MSRAHRALIQEFKELEFPARLSNAAAMDAIIECSADTPQYPVQKLEPRVTPAMWAALRDLLRGLTQLSRKQRGRGLDSLEQHQQEPK